MVPWRAGTGRLSGGRGSREARGWLDLSRPAPSVPFCTPPAPLTPPLQGTLFAYGAVCLGCLWRRYCVTGETPILHQRLIGWQLGGIVACGFWAGFGNQYMPGEWVGECCATVLPG